MSDPVRLLSQDEDAFTSSLLKSARDGDAQAARARKAAVLGAGSAAVGSAALAVTKASSAKGLWSILGTKWLSVAAFVTLGAGVGAAAVWPRDGKPAPESALPAEAAQRDKTAAAALPNAQKEPEIKPSAPDPAAPANAVATSDAPPQTALATPPDEAQARSRANAPPAAREVKPADPQSEAPAKAAPESGASELSQEVAALHVAREALGRGQPQKCLEAVDAYFAAFPKGHLSAEARVLRIEAMFAGGQKQGAAALARSLLAQNPKSPYAARLRTIAGEDANEKDR